MGARRRTALCTPVALGALLTCAAGLLIPSSARAAAAARKVPEVVATYPHDPEAFTQGLLLHAGRLYESTGLYGTSTVRKVEPTTGAVVQRVPLDISYFGEGLARVPRPGGDRLIQLTWRSGVAFVYDLESLQQLSTFTYDGEGWGLCYDAGAGRLVMSDGSSRLTFRDPETFEVTGGVDVTVDGESRDRLNELECVDGVVWANVWYTDLILGIDPTSGEARTLVDAAGLLASAGPLDNATGADVLNGIAHDPVTGRFLITGKKWPKLFEVSFVDPAHPTAAVSTPARSDCSQAPVPWTALGILAGLLGRRLRRPEPFGEGRKTRAS